ncbi:MAG: hypothetical protein IKE65_01190 [Clostridia bacterium]|nr:hypothetical protein [Clostridia bacterium]
MNKERHVYYQEPEQARKIEVAMKLSNCTSESDFVRTAIDFYIGYLFQNESLDYLSPVINRSIKNVIGGVEKSISDILFKLAVETGMTTRIIGGEYNLSDEFLEDLRGYISKLVAENNGILTLENARNDLNYG